jgi:hypothetical protein
MHGGVDPSDRPTAYRLDELGSSESLEEIERPSGQTKAGRV